MFNYERTPVADEESYAPYDTSVDHVTPLKGSRVKQYLWTDVDPEQSSVPLAAYCFMTGFVDSVTFTAVSVWCGFQTGNTIEMALALARLFALAQAPGAIFRVVDSQSLTSLVAFLIGAFLGRVGDRLGPRTRAWLFMGTLCQALFTMAAAFLLWQSGPSNLSASGPAWANPQGYAAIAFTSASMGLQGIMGKRLNTEFATTIVLTSVWCELMADPHLFTIRFVKSRDLKIIAVTSLFLGGFVGRALLDKIGSATTFFIGSGFRVLIAVWWLRVSGAEPVEEGERGEVEKGDEEKGRDATKGKQAEAFEDSTAPCC